MTPDVLGSSHIEHLDDADRHRPTASPTLLRRQAPSTWLVALEVGWFEGRRLLRHPLVLVGVAWYLVLLGTTATDGPGTTFDVLTTGPTFFIGVFAYFAANLVASRSRRHGCTEHHASLPSAATSRTAGLCLAALAPAVLALSISLTALAWHDAAGNLVGRPTVGEVVTGPLTVLGGGLLGIMIARWLPFPTASVVVMVGVVATNVWLAGRPETFHMLGTYVSFARWDDDGLWVGRYPGNAEWHAVYLVGLCAMAATGALLPEARRKLPVLAVGGLLTAATVAAGLMQLP
jgi:hypothetical protein